MFQTACFKWISDLKNYLQNFKVFGIIGLGKETAQPIDFNKLCVSSVSEGDLDEMRV